MEEFQSHTYPVKCLEDDFHLLKVGCAQCLTFKEGKNRKKKTVASWWRSLAQTSEAREQSTASTTAGHPESTGHDVSTWPLKKEEEERRVEMR